jgi:hypothetical protein
LIKELVTGLNVKIEASIRPPEYHDQKILVVDQELVGFEWGVEKRCVVLDPSLQVKR